MTATTRVLLVDDHPVFRLGLRALLDGIAEIEVVGEAASADEALATIPAAAPDLVLLDLHLPDRSGLEVVRELRRLHPGVAALVLTMAQDEDTLFAALRAGARGYLVKGADQDALVRAIQSVRAGDLVVGTAMADAVADGLDVRPAGPFPALTDREHEVLDLIARGFDNARVANRLFLSPKTVRNHLSNILGKLGASTRAEAIALARDAGLGVTSD